MGLTVETYLDVFDQLERDEVRYVVIGGVAVVLRGHVRAVADLDLAVDPAPDETRRALRSLSAVGFTPTIPLPLSAVTVLRTFDRLLREVDVFARPHVPFGELWAGSERLRVGRGVARVASLEHVLRAKRIDGRARDLSDIEGLLAHEAAAAARARSDDGSGEFMAMIFHITTREAWERAKPEGSYRPEAFAAEGFIHCSTREQVVRVADARFRGQSGLVLLCIDTGKVAAEIVYENLEGGRELFPHIYGGLNADAVAEVLEFEPDADGYFKLSED